MSTSIASVIASPKNVPILTPGKIQPESLTDWVHKCFQYFKTTRKLLAADHVATAATGLQDPLVQDWYMTGCDAFDLLTFTEFVLCMKKRWLNTGWEAEIVTHIIRSRQFENNLFEDWVITLEKKNTLLKGTTFHFDDTRLRDQITANACDNVRDACNLDSIRGILGFKEWKEALARVDAQRVKDRARMDARVNSVIAAQAAHRSATRSSSSHSHSLSSHPPSSSSGSSSVRNRPPRLTDEEKRLILKYHGCFKCRKLNVNHVSANCPDDFPSPVDYRPISEPSASSAKPTYSRPTAKVAMVGDLHNVTDTVAATSVLSMGDDYSSSDECVSPSSLLSPHIVWPAIVHSSSSFSLPTNMLIDNGCTTVLIRDDVVSDLGLRRRKLHRPFVMGAAWGRDGDSQNGVEWVKLRVSSPDMSFVACTVRAIVVPDLFVPIILGMPWLTKNNIVIDHELRCCIHKPSGIDILLPGPGPTPPPLSIDERRSLLRETVIAQQDAASLSFEEYQLQQNAIRGYQRDVIRELHLRANLPPPFITKEVTVIAAIKSRIEVLASLDRLAKEDAAMRARFPECFPNDIPHYDSLPNNVYHRIRLIDANKIISRRNYSCPKQLRDVWLSMLQEHLAAGRI
ncbi:hypothetical protein QCA50_012429 [Cerrena zonata]|uniref:Uncharacterized protein n=1 Tax=Cerrena zonata TaxID=2478898 RepID=A0AAW0FYS6_9APHY